MKRKQVLALLLAVAMTAKYDYAGLCSDGSGFRKHFLGL